MKISCTRAGTGVTVRWFADFLWTSVSQILHRTRWRIFYSDSRHISLLTVKFQIKFKCANCFVKMHEGRHSGCVQGTGLGGRRCSWRWAVGARTWWSSSSTVAPTSHSRTSTRRHHSTAVQGLCHVVFVKCCDDQYDFVPLVRLCLKVPYWWMRFIFFLFFFVWRQMNIAVRFFLQNHKIIVLVTLRFFFVFKKSI